jgi:hypothetical protein
LRRSSTGTTGTACSGTVGGRIVLIRIGLGDPVTNGPAAEVLQRPVADGSGGGGAVGEQMRDEPAQVVGRHLERFRAVEEVDQHPGGLGVGADGGVAAVLGP